MCHKSYTSELESPKNIGDCVLNLDHHKECDGHISNTNGVSIKYDASNWEDSKFL